MNLSPTTFNIAIGIPSALMVVGFIWILINNYRMLERIEKQEQKDLLWKSQWSLILQLDILGDSWLHDKKPFILLFVGLFPLLAFVFSWIAFGELTPVSPWYIFHQHLDTSGKLTVQK